MDKKRLRGFLRTMLENIVTTDIGQGQYERTHHFFGNDTRLTLLNEGEAPVDLPVDPIAYDGPSFFLVNDGCEAFDKYIKEINTDPIIKEKVGYPSLEKSVTALLRRFQDEHAAPDVDLDAAIREELKVLRSSVERWTSRAPIENLVLIDLPELIVGKVIFRAFSEEISTNFIELIKGGITSDENKHKVEVVSKEMNKHFHPGQICAEVTVEAESSRVEQLAKSEIDASLNLLRCYTNIIFPRPYSAYIGLPGEVIEADRAMLSIAENKSAFNLNAKFIGPLKPYRLTPTELTSMRRDFSFDILSNTLAKQESERSEMERAVTTAIRWLGRGIVAPDLPERILNFAAAIERLLIGDKENKAEIGDRFARRLTYLIEEDPTERLRVNLRAKHLYGMRSGVIHAGRTDVAEEDAIEMELFTFLALLAIAENLDKWPDHEKFIKWEQTQMFGNQ